MERVRGFAGSRQRFSLLGIELALVFLYRGWGPIKRTKISRRGIVGYCDVKGGREPFTVWGYQEEEKKKNKSER